MSQYPFRLVRLSTGRYFVLPIVNGTEGKPYEIPAFFKSFLDYISETFVIHTHQCKTSKLSYLRSDFIDLLHRAGKYQATILSSIRNIEKCIAAELENIEQPSVFIAGSRHGVFSISLVTGELLFETISEPFGRLLFSALQCQF